MKFLVIRNGVKSHIHKLQRHLCYLVFNQVVLALALQLENYHSNQVVLALALRLENCHSVLFNRLLLAKTLELSLSKMKNMN